MEMLERKFPEGFLWGASTSAYQCEGAALEDGKMLSQQDVESSQYAKRTGFADASVTSDHYHRYKEDIRLFKELGMKSYRFSIAWSRIIPDGDGEINEKGVSFYRAMIDECIANGIEPIVTLYHYDLPMALVEKYDGWISRQSVKDFERYARFVIETFKDKVKYWLTINEQSIIVQFWDRKNIVRDELKGNDQLRFQMNHHMNLAHAIACKLVHELVPGGKVGAALGYSPIYAASCKPQDAIAAMNAHDLKNSFYLDIYFKGHYNKAALRYLEKNGLAPVIEDGDMDIIRAGESDFLALNYYNSEAAKACPDDAARSWAGYNLTGKKGDMSGYETHPGFYQICKNPELDTTDWDWAIDPDGMEYILRDLYTRYNKPLMITENGLGAYDTLTEDGRVHDDARIDYIKKHLRAMYRAIDAGVEVISYNPWSAIDLLSTSNGYKKRYGLIYVDCTDDDVKDLKRYPKDSYYWYQKVIATNGASIWED